MSDLIWTPVKIKLGQIIPWTDNPRISTKAQAERLIKSERELGVMQTFAVSPFVDGKVYLYDGHQRYSAWNTVKSADFEITALQSNRMLSDDERRKVSILLHTATGSWSWDALSSWSAAELREWGMDESTLKGWNNDANNLKELLNAENADEVDAEPQIDRAAELQKLWQTETGQLWKLGEHRLLVGDCTVRENVERLMGGERAELVHADPPYGMGKENEGIENDNLYREKLDAFQMSWWMACRPFITENSSAYIWGNAEDLWRLWYCGGLRESERLTFRNEIVWAKGGSGHGMNNSVWRQYDNGSERCLFFMMGEQEMSRNSDNYWDGWESVRSYLEGEAKRLGINNAKLKEICGVESMYSHWFTKAQWWFINEKHYNELRDYYKGDGFKRDFDELKRDFDASRAYFNNTHDIMYEVWDFPPVKKAEERLGHATPKPTEMIERVIKSSSQNGGLIYVPFGGTCPEVIAAQNLGRRCYAMEISPAYCAVILQRFADATGIQPELVKNVAP